MTEFAAFSDKVCVITGAGSGIGRAMAVTLARSGARLALSDINEDGLEETKQLIGQQTNKHRYDALDVSDEGAIPVYAESVKESLGNADYVFNVAGLTRLGSFEETPLSSFEKVMDVNYWGVVRMCKAFLPQVIETKGGFTNISSVFGLIGYPGQTHYCSSKFAVRGFSETLATELEDKGVSVTSVHPGGVATNIARSAEVDSMPENGASREQMNERFDEAARTSPDKAASIILNGTAKGKRRVLVGNDATMISTIQRLLPTTYWRFLSKVFPDLNK